MVRHVLVIQPVHPWIFEGGDGRCEFRRRRRLTYLEQGAAAHHIQVSEGDARPVFTIVSGRVFRRFLPRILTVRRVFK